MSFREYGHGGDDEMNRIKNSLTINPDPSCLLIIQHGAISIYSKNDCQMVNANSFMPEINHYKQVNVVISECSQQCIDEYLDAT